MPPITSNFFESEVVLVTLKIGMILILIMYFIFSLIIIRQMDLMSKALIAKVSPFLKMIALIHALFAAILIAFAIKTL